MQSRLLSSLKPATQTCIETGQPPNSACSITAAYLLHSDDDGGVMTASSSAHSSVAPPHLRLRLDSTRLYVKAIQGATGLLKKKGEMVARPTVK